MAIKRQQDQQSNSSTANRYSPSSISHIGDLVSSKPKDEETPYFTLLGFIQLARRQIAYATRTSRHNLDKASYDTALELWNESSADGINVIIFLAGKVSEMATYFLNKLLGYTEKEKVDSALLENQSCVTSIDFRL